MAIIIPEYKNPYDPAHPIQNAYAWNSFLALDLFSGNGRIQLNVNPSESAWQAQPIDTISIGLGQVYTHADHDANPPVAEVRMKTLEELMKDADFAAAYNTIGAKIYAAALEVVPALQGGEVV